MKDNWEVDIGTGIGIGLDADLDSDFLCMCLELIILCSCHIDNFTGNRTLECVSFSFQFLKCTFSPSF